MPATAQFAEFVSAAQRFKSAEDASVKTRQSLAVEREVRAFFDGSADAASEATRQQSLFGAERDIYRVIVRGHQFKRALGETVTLKYPRFGLSAGKDYIVIGLREDTRLKTTELVLWG